MKPKVSPQLPVSRPQLMLLSIIALSLLLTMFFIGLNLVQNLRKQNYLLENDLARSIRPIAQLQREVLRLFVLVKNDDHIIEAEPLTLQINLVNSRLTAMQRHYTNYKSEQLIKSIIDVKLKWKNLQIELEPLLTNSINKEQKEKLNQDLTEFELLINDLQSQYEVSYSAQSAALAEQSSQSLWLLGNISLLFVLFLAFVGFNTSRVSKERRRVVEALHESEERYRRIVETAQEGICLLDDSDQISFMNSKMAELLGGKAEEIYHKTLLGFMASDEKSIQTYLERLHQGIAWQDDFKFRREDSTTLWMLINCAPIFDKQAHYTGALAMVTDITHRKMGEEALQEAKQAAEAANQAKSDFLSSVSHELRTPLNGILGYAQILRRHQELDQNVIDGLRIIHQSGNHLLTLINELLDLSKIEARKMELFPQKLHLPSFLENIISLMQNPAKQKKLTLLYEPVGELPTGILADEKRLRQILLNLLGNAIKFTDEGQIILRVSQLSDKQCLRFCVIDTGIGMSEAEIKQSFLPFEQITHHNRQTEGTGLGLTITQKLVRLMGSEIKVKSQVGRGSEFYFDFNCPYVTVEAPDKTEQARREIIGYKGKRRQILVVDDQLENRLVLLDMLSPLGFEVHQAQNGQQALQQSRESLPDLILIDLMMPVMNGFNAIKEIRKVARDLPIIVVSAKIMPSATQKKETADGLEKPDSVDVFLPKPINQQDLLDVLEKQLALEWLYQEEHSIASQKANSEWLIAPPQKELQQLYRWATLGMMKQLRQHAKHISLEQKYAPFANRLYELAKGFEDEKILALLEEKLAKYQSG